MSAHCHEENADIDEDSYSGSGSDKDPQFFLGAAQSSGGSESESQFRINDTGKLHNIVHFFP